jgi:type 1 glutamine amidotransferase
MKTFPVRLLAPPLPESVAQICGGATASLLAFLCSTALLPAAEPSTNPTESTNHARVLIVTGIDYPGHHWRETAPVLAQALRQDTRLDVYTVEDPNFLDSAALEKYDLVVLHFENWQQPGPGERSRDNLRKFVASGKGLALVHFACGAWHQEWPEFEKLAGRVWFGSDPGPGKRQHDPYGPFRVEMVTPQHPLVRGISDFDTQDELYTCLIGEAPIEVVAHAKSKVDGQYYPMAFLAHYGQGRTFHCVLGHDVAALSVPGVQELYRRGCAWAAGLSPTRDQSPPPGSK